MSDKNGIYQILGKTVREVIINNSCKSESPSNHLFLIFSDGTSYEFYGWRGNILTTSGLSYNNAIEYAMLFDSCKSICRYYKNEYGENLKDDLIINHCTSKDITS